MHLSRLGIHRLGQLRDVTIEPLSPQLTVVYGPNEAGKSTIRDAIRYALFGFPSKNPGRSALDARTYAGADRHVAARFVGSEGEIYIERTVDGRKLSEGALVVAPDSAVPALRSMTEGIDGQMYHTIWNVSLANLGTIDPSRDGEPVLAKLLAAEHGTAVSPSTAIAALTKDMDALFSSKQKDAPSIKSSVGRVADLRDRLRQARSQAAAIEGVRAQLAEVNDAIQAASELRRSLQARRATAADDAAALARLTDEAPGVAARVREAEAEYQLASERAAAGQSEEIRKLLALAPQVQSLELERALVEDKRSEADRIQSSIDELSTRLDRYADVPRVLDGADSERLISQLDQLQRQLVRAQDDLSVAQSNFDAAQQRVEGARGHGPGASTYRFAPAALALVVGLAVTLIAWLSRAGNLTTIASAAAAVIMSGALWWFTSRTSGNVAISSEDGVVAGATAALRARQTAAAGARDQWTTFVSSDPLLRHLADRSPDEVVALARQSATRAQLEGDLAVKTSQLERALSLRQKWGAEVEAVLAQASAGAEMRFHSLDTLASAVRAADLAVANSNLASESLTRLQKSLDSAREQQSRHSASMESLLETYDTRSPQEGVSRAAAVLGEIDDALARADERHSELRSRFGELSHEIQAAEASHDVERLEADLEMATSRLKIQTRSYVVALLARTIVEQGMEHFEGAGKPGVMESAGEIFSQLTGGAYEGIEVPQGDAGEIDIVGAGGARKPVAHLSVGTVEQLYLAIRLGALLALPNRGRDLPVLLDDVLANYDGVRSTHGYAAIAELAQSRQVIYFTCREDVAAGLCLAARAQGVDTVQVSMEAGQVVG